MAGGKRLRYDPALMNLRPLHLLLAVALLHALDARLTLGAGGAARRAAV